MLKKLLKYEFQATCRVYGGLYLAFLAAAALMGASFRVPALLEHTAPIAVLMLVYLALGVAIAVMTVLTIIQRFTRNLLGREGYLMHTLPVSNAQLILAKLLSSMVWVLCSILVVLLSFVLFSLFGTVVASDVVSELLHSLSGYWGEVTRLLGAVFKDYGVTLVLMALEWLASLACAILCVYTACMIGHWCKKHFVAVGIAAFVVLNMAQNQLLNLLPYNTGNTGLDLVFSTAMSDGGTVYMVTGNKAYLWAVLAALAADLALCAVYFAATSWLMKHKLDLE